MVMVLDFRLWSWKMILFIASWFTNFIAYTIFENVNCISFPPLKSFSLVYVNLCLGPHLITGNGVGFKPGILDMDVMEKVLEAS